MREEVTFSRNAEAIMIPSGERVLVPQGSQATITQALGGAFTLITERGLMVRISGKEVEAIGKEPQESNEIKPEDLTPEKIESMVWEALKTCYDPEIPVNIVDLGLVYLCELQEGEEGGKKVHVKMTLTAPGCGMGPVLASDVRMKLEALPGVKQADVEVVFDPVWDRSMMSEAARLQLGMMW
ncbi:MAG: putative Fe-S cluster assembly protein SufT [Acidobacteria bacterium]|nr:putative Fe-S cluster assembly protein SufT [Acidobacteriota bacterium]MBV9477224.1 putative Fe-S cluster assembly protein SufT [Acidobacteriota bacterium]